MTVVISGYEILIDQDEAWRLSKYCYHASFRMNNPKPYFRCSIKHKTKYLHRQIMNCPKGMIVDHINGNTLDNRKCNLRICTEKQNAENRAIQKNNTTGFKGVRKHRKKYAARIRVNGKLKYLGLFDSPLKAGRAYEIAAKKYFGEFARLA